MVKIFRFDADTHITCNTYIIGKIGNYCLVVDMGSTSDEIYQYISTHYEKCLGVLLTHAHFDHIRGLNKFIKHFPYEVPIYMNQADSALLNDSIANESRYHQEDVKININPIFVQDEEELMFKKDIKVKVITTPFHTEGSVCYLFDDDNALFSGDTLFQNIYTALGGPWQIAVASCFPGSIKAFEITPGNAMILQKSAFLASSRGVELSMHFRKKLGSGLFGGEGFIMQKVAGNGIVFAEFDGHVVEYNHEARQQILLDTGHLAAMSQS